MAGGRNFQALVRGYLKGEVIKQEQAAEQAKLRQEADQKAKAQKIAFNSSIVKDVITENPEMFKELDMSYEQMTSDAGLQTVLSYVKDKNTDAKIKDKYLDLAFDVIKKKPELYKSFDVSQYDITTPKGQEALYQAAIALYQADNETNTDQYKGYRVFGKGTNDEFLVRFTDNPNTFEEYYANGNNFVNALVLNGDKYSRLPKKEQIEFAQTLENQMISASSKHLSSQQQLKAENPNHEFRDIEWTQIGRLTGSEEYKKPYQEFFTNLKEDTTYDLIGSIYGQKPTMVGQKTKPDGTVETQVNFEDTGQLGILMEHSSTDSRPIANEKQLAAAYPELVTSDNRIFKLAQTILTLPGMQPDIPYKDNPKAKSLLQLHQSAFSLTPSMRTAVGVTMLDAIEQGMQPEEAMLALGLLINRDVNQEGGMLYSKTDSISKEYSQIIKQITLLSGKEGVDKISEMASAAKEALDLSKEYLRLVKGKKIKVGLAGFIDNKFVNLVGNGTGQIDSLMDLFSSEDEEFGFDSFRDKGYERIQQEIKSAQDYQNTLTGDRRKAYGEAAALRIYLAYTLAKVFDPSGRVSDKDLDNVLSAFAGDGNIVSPEYVEGMLGISIDRLSRKYQRFSILAGYDPSNVTRADVQRISGAIAFSRIMASTNSETVRDKKYVVENMSIATSSPLGLKPRPDLTFTDENQIERTVYQVFNKTNNTLVSPLFSAANNLYVYFDNNNASNLAYIPSASVKSTATQTSPSDTTQTPPEIITIQTSEGPVQVDQNGNRIDQ
tara:strand:+ start:780 stop:3110 length:2331 start_codon:yes stop_codon:yes gene_type:complete